MDLKNIKIGYVSGNYYNPLTGGDKHNIRLVKSMSGYGMNPYHAWIDRMPRGTNIIKGFVSYFSKIFLKSDIILLDCGFHHSLLISRLSRIFRPKVPLVGIIHYMNSRRPSDVEDVIFWKKWETRLFKSLDAIVCANPFAYRQLNEAGIPDSKIFLNTGGYHTDFISKKRKKPSNKVNIMFCGYVGKIKGVHILLEALRLLNSKLPFHCHILGSLSKYPEYARQMIDLTVNSGLVDKVSYWGHLTGFQLNKMFELCHMMVLPSLYEGYPLSIIESQCKGLAVISTDAGGTPDALEDGVSGILVPARDPVSLSKAIHRVATDENLRKNLVEGGFKHLESLPTWDQTCRKFSKILKSIISHEHITD